MYNAPNPTNSFIAVFTAWFLLLLKIISKLHGHSSIKTVLVRQKKIQLKNLYLMKYSHFI